MSFLKTRYISLVFRSRKKLPDNPNSNASGMKIWVEESAPSRAQNHYSPLAQIDQFRDNRLILQTGCMGFMIGPLFFWIKFGKLTFCFKDSLRANSSTESDRSYEKVFELKSFSGDLDIHQKRSGMTLELFIIDFSIIKKYFSNVLRVRIIWNSHLWRIDLHK